MSDPQTGPTAGEPPADTLVSPEAPGSAPPPARPAESTRGHGVLIAVGIALAIGALSAAIISNGDDDATSTVAPTPTVQSGTTTVRNVTTTVTAPPANITVVPDVTLAPDGSVNGPGDGGSQTATDGGSQTGTEGGSQTGTEGGSQTGATPTTTTGP